MNFATLVFTAVTCSLAIPWSSLLIALVSLLLAASADTVMGSLLLAGVHQDTSLPGLNQASTWAVLSGFPTKAGPQPSLAYHDAFEEYSSSLCRFSPCVFLEASF